MLEDGRLMTSRHMMNPHGTSKSRKIIDGPESSHPPSDIIASPQCDFLI